MRNSDIFDSYAKLALEKGLIKEASSDDIKKKLEENPRMDSLDISAIEALYGVKPKLPKDMEYDKNISEIAHPNSVVVSPAHDKINGLVENINERQNILLHIVNKDNNGQLVQKKLAEKNLVLELVRLGNDLDNSNRNELRILADTCLEQTACLTKNAQIAEVAVTLAPIAIILGGLYLQQHLPYVNEGLKINSRKLIVEIDDMLESNAFIWGRDYAASFKNMLQEFKNKIIQFQNIYERMYPVIESIEKPKTAQELLQLSNTSESDIIKKANDIMTKAIQNFLPYIISIETNFKSELYKVKQIEDKGGLEWLIDKTQILHGGKGLIADDFDDVARAIKPYKESMKNILDIFNNAKSFQDDSKAKLDTAASEMSRVAPQQEITQVTQQDKPSEERSFIDEVGRGFGDLLNV
jgi:hypothetical protein